MKLAGMFALVSVVAATAVAQDVRYNFDKTADFTKFKTYKWIQIKDSPQLDQLTEQQLKQGIDDQLKAKGLTPTDSDSASLFVGYQAAINQEKQYSSYTTGMGPGWGYGGGWGAWGGGSSMTTGTTSTLYIGTLAVDMYDPLVKQLVWRGSVSKTLDPKAKPDKRQKNLTKALTKLFKNYPPVVKK